MPKPLSNDLRARLIKNVKLGLSARAAGRQLAIAASTATGIVQDWRERGHDDPLPQGGHRRSCLEQEADCIEQMVRDHSDWSEAELNAH